MGLYSGGNYFVRSVHEIHAVKSRVRCCRYVRVSQEQARRYQTEEKWPAHEVNRDRVLCETLSSRGRSLALSTSNAVVCRSPSYNRCALSHKSSARSSHDQFNYFTIDVSTFSPAQTIEYRRFNSVIQFARLSVSAMTYNDRRVCRLLDVTRRTGLRQLSVDASPMVTRLTPQDASDRRLNSVDVKFSQPSESLK